MKDLLQGCLKDACGTSMPSSSRDILGALRALWVPCVLHQELPVPAPAVIMHHSYPQASLLGLSHLYSPVPFFPAHSGPFPFIAPSPLWSG